MELPARELNNEDNAVPVEHNLAVPTFIKDNQTFYRLCTYRRLTIGNMLFSREPEQEAGINHQFIYDECGLNLISRFDKDPTGYLIYSIKPANSLDTVLCDALQISIQLLSTGLHITSYHLYKRHIPLADREQMLGILDTIELLYTQFHNSFDRRYAAFKALGT
jgi:hypothetical protein